VKRKAKPQMPRITEAQFTTQVIRLAQVYGWTVCHFRPAKTAKGYRTALQGDAGFPDIVAARNGRKIVAELKVGTRRATPEQLQWLAAWGADAYLWYPRDWDQIEAVFSGRL
jgi:hypothetical protein